MADSISELQHDIANPHVTVVTLLQKAMPLATRLGDSNFVTWASRELRGFPKEDPTCEYRRLKGQYVVLAPDGRSLPIAWQGEAMNLRFITLPLAELESILVRDGDTIAITVSVAPKAIVALDAEPGSAIAFSIQRATLLGFLSAIRQRVLEWSLKLRSISGSETTSTFNDAPPVGEVPSAIATLFYSWQSDLPNSTNRGFIEECLKRAIKELKAEGQLRVEPCLDRDTMNVPGSPDIAATIFDKIESAALFVCDVSIINQGTEGRPTPNPNVLIELGYAVKALGWNRVVCVLNQATGEVENLPFDLRHRRFRGYRLHNGGDKGDARKLLVGHLKTEIEAAFSFVKPKPSAETDQPAAADQWRIPKIEILDATLECQPPIAAPSDTHVHRPRPQYVEGKLAWTVTATLFVDSRPGDVLTIALHRCEGWMNDRHSGQRLALHNLSFHAAPQSQVSVDDAVLQIRGPGKVMLQGACDTPFRSAGYPDIVTIDVRLPISETQGIAIDVSLELHEVRQRSGWPLRWKYQPPSP